MTHVMMSEINNKRDTRNSFSLIFDEIDSDAAKQIIAYILESNFTPVDERPDVLNILINSPGGSLTDAFAIIDVMKSSHIPIQTIGIGQIASAALLIFMNGTPGRRILTPNTSIMSHRWASGSIGKSHELVAVAREYELTNERMFDVYRRCTGLKDSVIRSKLLPPEDVYLSAEEALSFKICDKISLLD